MDQSCTVYQLVISWKETKSLRQHFINIVCEEKLYIWSVDQCQVSAQTLRDCIKDAKWNFWALSGLSFDDSVSVHLNVIALY